MFAPGLEASWVCIVVTSIGNREASIVGMFCNKRLKVAGFRRGVPLKLARSAFSRQGREDVHPGFRQR